MNRSPLFPTGWSSLSEGILGGTPTLFTLGAGFVILLPAGTCLSRYRVMPHCLFGTLKDHRETAAHVHVYNRSSDPSPHTTSVKAGPPGVNKNPANCAGQSVYVVSGPVSLAGTPWLGSVPIAVAVVRCVSVGTSKMTPHDVTTNEEKRRIPGILFDAEGRVLYDNHVTE